VQRGTKIFVVAWSFECSSFEGNGTTDAELRSCALAVDSGITLVSVSVDGIAVPVSRVQTDLLGIHLPKDNIFGVSGTGRNGLSVGDGWVTLLDALPRGTHTIVIHHEGSGLPPVTTKIVVV
jgi:hypothetical protein